MYFSTFSLSYKITVQCDLIDKSLYYMLLHFVNSNIFCNLKPLTSLCAMCVLSWTHYLSKHLKLAAVTVTLPEGSSLTGKEEVALDDPGFYLLTEHSETLHYQQIIHR